MVNIENIKVAKDFIADCLEQLNDEAFWRGVFWFSVEKPEEVKDRYPSDLPLEAYAAIQRVIQAASCVECGNSIQFNMPSTRICLAYDENEEQPQKGLFLVTNNDEQVIVNDPEKFWQYFRIEV